jgi:hypothetical protein
MPAERNFMSAAEVQVSAVMGNFCMAAIATIQILIINTAVLWCLV